MQRGVVIARGPLFCVSFPLLSSSTTAAAASTATTSLLRDEPGPHHVRGVRLDFQGERVSGVWKQVLIKR